MKFVCIISDSYVIYNEISRVTLNVKHLWYLYNMYTHMTYKHSYIFV